MGELVRDVEEDDSDGERAEEPDGAPGCDEATHSQGEEEHRLLRQVDEERVQWLARRNRRGLDAVANHANPGNRDGPRHADADNARSGHQHPLQAEDPERREGHHGEDEEHGQGPARHARGGVR